MNALIDWITGNKVKSDGVAVSTGLLATRLGTGLLMAFGHGWGKLVAYGERAAQFADPLGVGSPLSLALVVFAEFFCALALAVGLLTRAVVIPLIVTMLVAAFVIHGDDPFSQQEKALLFLVPLVTILITGPGRYSLDRIIARR
jgi:putative oxidoreductase